MRLLLIGTCCFALTACGMSAETECETARTQLDECVRQFADADVIRECVPLGEQRKFVGSWAQDFEWNRFFANRRVDSNEAFQTDAPPVELHLDAPVQKDGAGRKLRTISEVEFIGREEKCPVVPDMQEQIIVVDKVLSQRTYFAQPSFYQ